MTSQTAVSAGGGEVQPIETALVFGGFCAEAVERFGDRFRAMGMTSGGGAGRGGGGGDEAAGAAGAGVGGERDAGAGRSFDLGDVHGDVCGPDAAAGVRASDYAVWAGVDADDQGGGGGDAGVVR